MNIMAIFDKSFLQALNPDEAAIFDALFMTNITPLFLVETLADLEKEIKNGRTPEEVVGSLSYKTPRLHSYPNVGHWGLCRGDLAGFSVEMDHTPVVGRAKAVRLPGKTGIVYDHPPEMKALDRWCKGDFLGVERAFAQKWRTRLSMAPRNVKPIIGVDGEKLRLSNLQQVKNYSEQIVIGDGRRYKTLKAAIGHFDMTEKYGNAIVKRWKDAGGPPLHHFAPYAAFVFMIDIFFHVAVSTSHISAERASNRVDVSYLYYLPFTDIFISGDKLHAKGLLLNN